MHYLKVFLFLLLVCSYSKAEELNTENLLNEADTWDQTGLVSSDTCSYSGALLPGEVCFGHAATRGEVDGGGTITSDQLSLIDDGGLSIQELNQGFTIDYGFTAESHLSNSNLPTCSQTNGDCRDIIDYTLTLSEPGGQIINTYNHYIELDFTGLRDYEYSQTIGENDYSDILTQVSIYGVDAGYTNGYYGAILSDPYLDVHYTTVILVDEIIDIIEDVVDSAIIEDFPDIIEIEIDLPELVEAPIELEIDLTTDIELPELELETIEQIEIIEVVEVVDASPAEMNIEMELEQEMEAAIEETIQESTDEPTEPEPSTDDVETSEPGETTEEEQEPEPEQEDQEQEEEPRETLTVEKKQEVKQKIVKKIMNENKNKSDPSSQAQTMALMIVLTDTQGFSEYLTQELVEPIVLQDQSLPLQEMLPDPYSDLFGAAQNSMMDTLVNSQY